MNKWLYSILFVIFVISGIFVIFFGIFPAFFLYPSKEWSSSSEMWDYILTKDNDRIYWQISTPIFLIILLVVKEIRNKIGNAIRFLFLWGVAVPMVRVFKSVVEYLIGKPKQDKS
jgi:hypothetical protein